MADPAIVQSDDAAELVVGLAPAASAPAVIEAGIARILKLIPPASRFIRLTQAAMSWNTRITTGGRRPTRNWGTTGPPWGKASGRAHAPSSRTRGGWAHEPVR